MQMARAKVFMEATARRKVLVAWKEACLTQMREKIRAANALSFYRAKWFLRWHSHWKFKQQEQSRVERMREALRPPVANTGFSQPIDTLRLIGGVTVTPKDLPVKAMGFVRSYADAAKSIHTSLHRVQEAQDRLRTPEPAPSSPDRPPLRCLHPHSCESNEPYPELPSRTRVTLYQAPKHKKQKLSQKQIILAEAARQSSSSEPQAKRKASEEWGDRRDDLIDNVHKECRDSQSFADRLASMEAMLKGGRRKRKKRRF
jgi:hypothetical protein